MYLFVNDVHGVLSEDSRLTTWAVEWGVQERFVLYGCGSIYGRVR